MAIKIRTTEKHPHPVWDKFVQAFPVAELQGFTLACSAEELTAATKNHQGGIVIHCLEAIEYQDDSELIPEMIFSHQDWVNKISAAEFFGSPMLLLTYKENDEVLFRLFEVRNTAEGIVFHPREVFIDEAAFMDFWIDIKKIKQTKKTVEAKERQALTLFDEIIERNGASWGGNMDGFVLSKDGAVKVIIEVRQSRKQSVTNYDPAKYFGGTQNKGGDFMTWLPMVYLKYAYNIPIVLITLSTLDEELFGFTEVATISSSKLYYRDDISPTRRVTNDFEKFRKWLITLIERN